MSVNSGALKTIIAESIQAANGFLSFDQFMQHALYEPKLGYYESAHVFGADGDFVTGADLGPWLSLGFADLMHWGWQQLGCPKHWVLLEQGGGSGRLLRQVVAYLEQFEMAAPKLIAVERSAQMRQRQQQHYQEHGLSVRQYATLAEVKTDMPVLMMCNELPDAFPVRCFEYKNNDFYERGVGLVDGEFAWVVRDCPMQDKPNIAAHIIQQWPDGYVGEFNPNLQAWQQQVADIIGDGFVFCVDYGYSQKEYYRKGRVEGTLMGHQAHQVVENVLAEPGVCDITAHIDFSDLAQSGQACGLLPCSFITQGAWLAQSPNIQQAVTTLAQQKTAESVQALAHAKRMLLPFGMGESFKLLLQSKRLQAPEHLKPLDRLADLQLNLPA